MIILMRESISYQTLISIMILIYKGAFLQNIFGEEIIFFFMAFKWRFLSFGKTAEQSQDIYSL